MERLTGPQLRTLQSNCVDNGGSSQVEEMEVEELGSSRAMYAWIFGKRPSW